MRCAPTWLVAVGCVAPEPVLDATTDGGTWAVSLEAPRDAGNQVLVLTVAPEDGVLVGVTTSMPSMGHGSDGAVAPADGGGFEVTVELTMSGWWVLDGTVARTPEGEGAEAFLLEFEVP